MTFSIAILAYSITVKNAKISITTGIVYDKCLYSECYFTRQSPFGLLCCVIMLNIVILSVILLNVVMLSVIMQSVIMLSVIMLSVVTLNVKASQ
jgi:hypothetical protein